MPTKTRPKMIHATTRRDAPLPRNFSRHLQNLGRRMVYSTIRRPRTRHPRPIHRTKPLFNGRNPSLFRVHYLLRHNGTHHLHRAKRAPKLTTNLRLFRRHYINARNVTRPRTHRTMRLNGNFRSSRVSLPRRAFYHIRNVIKRRVRRTFIRRRRNTTHHTTIRSLLRRQRNHRLTNKIIKLTRGRRIRPQTSNHARHVHSHGILLLSRGRTFRHTTSTFRYDNVLHGNKYNSRHPTKLSNPSRPRSRIYHPVTTRSLLHQRTLVRHRLYPRLPTRKIEMTINHKRYHHSNPNRPFQRTRQTSVNQGVRQIPPRLNPMANPVTTVC